MSLSKISGGSSSSATSCAACKFQRKKCPRNCLLAPYFPQDRQNEFLNAHKLFGISNITKMLQGIQESQRHIAMQNLILHANTRALDPVGGPFKIMCDLKRKIEYLQGELNLVHQQISMCRSLFHPQQMQMQMQMQRQDRSFGCYSYGDLLEQGEEYVNADGYDQQQNLQQHQEMMQQQSYEMFLQMPEQTSKEKLDKEGISDPEQQFLEPETHAVAGHLSPF